ncbi:potassium channel subfamily K member 4-like [Mizuhopecten yessoensis]|nr:potassium channel subfamily K member 4-like [Mizuhopecten yessoensis]XP_021362019.1 potassium channel subfamily K member 4-like [Mizuhopecten yessoensis]XP_021362020.1 potassium channel subfamily K member 4-like [Mizuhopecten yessoensis]
METTETNNPGSSRRKPEAAVAAVSENLSRGVTFCTKCLRNLKKFLQTVYSIIKSLIGLIIILIIYTLIGAALFQAVERPYEQQQKNNLISYKQQVLKNVKNNTYQLQSGKISMDVWENRTRDLLDRYESTARSSAYGSISEEKWSFYGALFFCGTVYTTIGYGNIVPMTSIGKIFAIVYAITGIPLAMIVLAELGRKFTIGLKLLLVIIRRFNRLRDCRRVLQRRFCPKENSKDVEEGDVKNGPKEETEKQVVQTPEEKKAKVDTFVRVSPDGQPTVVNGKDIDQKTLASNNTEDAEEVEGDEEAPVEGKKHVNIVFGVEIDEEFNLPPSLALAIMVIYLLIGCMMYPAWEDWSFLDSFYFVFISMSTIGFGDILPAHPKFFLISGIYLFIGLSLISMCINVGIEFFTKTIKRAKKRMNKAKDKMAEISKEKMSEVGKHMDKAKDKMSQVTDKVAEVTDKMAEEVKKNVENVQREMITKTGSKSGTPVPSPTEDDNKGSKAGTPVPSPSDVKRE